MQISSRRLARRSVPDGGLSDRLLLSQSLLLGLSPLARNLISRLKAVAVLDRSLALH